MNSILPCALIYFGHINLILLGMEQLRDMTFVFAADGPCSLHGLDASHYVHIYCIPHALVWYHSCTYRNIYVHFKHARVISDKVDVSTSDMLVSLKRLTCARCLLL